MIVMAESGTGEDLTVEVDKLVGVDDVGRVDHGAAQDAELIRILNNNQTSVSHEASLVARLGNFFGWFTSTATAESKSNILLTEIIFVI